MTTIDDINHIQALDKSDMYKAVAGFPEQIRDAIWAEENSGFDPAPYKGITRIILCGMGGSAIGGDLARSVLFDNLTIPFDICRDYHLPAYADQNTLVIGSSYSGNTEETLSAFTTAIEKKCRLFVITTGGQLGEIAERQHIPMMKPRTGYQPRAALSYSFSQLMLFFSKIGISPFDEKALIDMAVFLKRRLKHFTLDNPIGQNMTKQLAEKMRGRIPIIYSGPGLTAPAAVRFKGQICENAKQLAFANQFPEFNHNELVGWEAAKLYKEKFIVVVLRDRDDDPRISKRMDVVEGLIAQKDIDVIEVESVGENRLERLMSLIQVADFTSFYLAIFNAVDPTPVAPIEMLKKAIQA